MIVSVAVADHSGLRPADAVTLIHVRLNCVKPKGSDTFTATAPGSGGARGYGPTAVEAALNAVAALVGGRPPDPAPAGKGGGPVAPHPEDAP